MIRAKAFQAADGFDDSALRPHGGDRPVLAVAPSGLARTVHCGHHGVPCRQAHSATAAHVTYLNFRNSLIVLTKNLHEMAPFMHPAPFLPG